MVRIRNSITVRRRPSCAPRTASTMVKLLHSSTAVLAAPMISFSVPLASAKTLG